MIPTSSSSLRSCSEDTQIWEQLKQVIASSSGFQRWQIESSLDGQSLDGQSQGQSLDYRIRSYLRETLETLSY